MAFNPADHLGDIKGKAYLEVKWRVVWFREDHPYGGIHTEIIPAADLAIVRATVVTDSGQVLGTGHGTAAFNASGVVWKGKAIEKAETAAIGRALAHAGYGTQFTEDDEDADEPVDSPVERRVQPEPQPEPPPAQPRSAYAPRQQGVQAGVAAEGETAIVSSVVIRRQGEKKFLSFMTPDKRMSIGTYTREAFRKGGYEDSDTWEKVGVTYEINPPAVVHFVRKPHGGREYLNLIDSIPAEKITAGEHVPSDLAGVTL